MPTSRKQELIDQRGKLDAAISEARAIIDAHARGCRYRELAEVAERVVVHAKAAEACRQELDKLLVAEWEARRR